MKQFFERPRPASHRIWSRENTVLHLFKNGGEALDLRTSHRHVRIQADFQHTDGVLLALGYFLTARDAHQGGGRAISRCAVDLAIANDF